MKSIPITEFKKMLVKDIKENGSFNIIADGEYLGTFVIPASAFRKNQIEAICGQMNAGIGK